VRQLNGDIPALSDVPLCSDSAVARLVLRIGIDLLTEIEFIFEITEFNEGVFSRP